MPHDDGAIRITTASSSRHEDIAARQRRYVLSMSLRTVCFIGAVIADGWLRWVLVAGAVLLPYLAVVMANVSTTKSDGFDLTHGPSGRRELPESTGSEGIGGSDRI
ncbi:hypothetical protein GCM10009623_38230 [Nocardioides aestuarii]|uniref:DUF3099 domain-containing protein n=1 Tax=Nocardioides aestuarii TaxID=252231 RepID=A0ABW4TT61_9ACTN